MRKLKALPGLSFPIGATYRDNGVNFSLFSKNSIAVELWFFDHPEDGEPSHVFKLDTKENRTCYYWNIFIEGVKPGQLYGYKVQGPFTPHVGRRFDGEKLLLDPYGKATVEGKYNRQHASRPGNNAAYAMKSVVVDGQDYDWENTTPLRRAYKETIIYELHVKGFTMHPESGVDDKLRGTFRGVIEKIPYLKSLGITAVELMPIQHFDKQHAPEGLSNYWGYSPVSLFAPHLDYSTDRSPLGPVNEFKDMVRELHRNGIEVILDVVFNHTAEDSEVGPTLSFKGLENRAYYIMDNKGRYQNYTGVGNTLNANHSVTRRLIMDCLRYWVSEMHVDGFRFDLASVMARDETGIPIANAPILWAIDSDPVLATTKIIAEAWDAVGLYQLGHFTGERWAEWNGKYRDDIRQFVKGDENMVPELSNRIVGSPDVFQIEHRDPNQSINFVTSHDGFTLNDVVSYNQKHNDANGENNRDGMDANYSWNCGVEGATDDPEVEALRVRQIRNFFTLLMISQGTPMFTMGDEVRRTQHGNNNPYCQDNEITWMDWELIEKHEDLLNFVRLLIDFRKNTPHLKEDIYWTDIRHGASRIQWHGTKSFEPDWSSTSHSLAFTLNHHVETSTIHVMINAYWNPLTFELPAIGKSQKGWYTVIDTSRPAGQNSKRGSGKVKGKVCRLEPRSIMICMAK